MQCKYILVVGIKITFLPLHSLIFDWGNNCFSYLFLLNIMNTYLTALQNFYYHKNQQVMLPNLGVFNPESLPHHFDDCHFRSLPLPSRKP